MTFYASRVSLYRRARLEATPRSWRMNSAGRRERANATANERRPSRWNEREGPGRSRFPFISSIHSRRSRQRRREDLPRIMAAGPALL